MQWGGSSGTERFEEHFSGTEEHPGRRHLPFLRQPLTPGPLPSSWGEGDRVLAGGKLKRRFDIGRCGYAQSKPRAAVQSGCAARRMLDGWRVLYWLAAMSSGYSRRIHSAHTSHWA